MKTLLSVLLLLPLSALASDPCDNATSTPEINQCGQIAHQKADRQLNQTYRAAIQRINETLDDAQVRRQTTQSLVAAQRLWVQFRDKDCGAIYRFWSGGTIRGAMYWSCMRERTEARTKELMDAYLEQR